MEPRLGLWIAKIALTKKLRGRYLDGIFAINFKNAHDAIGTLRRPARYYFGQLLAIHEATGESTREERLDTPRARVCALPFGYL